MVKESMSKNIRDGIKTVSYQIENINKERNCKEESNRNFKVEKQNN